MSRRVADEVAEVLSAAGIRYSFQITGGDQSLWIALHAAQIRMVLGRSEQGATYMADGYARVTCRPALTYGQHGPGAANVAASLADAFWASSPVVALTSGVATGARNRFAYQELDQQRLFGPVTRWSTAVTRPDRLAEAVRIAVHTAASGPMGPTHVDVPRDMIEHEVSWPTVAADIPPTTFPGDGPSPSALRAIVEVLNTARRPMILAGSGSVRGSRPEAVRELAERLSIPVATTPGGKGVIDEEHPLSVGQTGRYAGIVPNQIGAEADVVLVLGSRLGTMSTRDSSVPSPAATIIHVDTDDSVFGRTYREAVTVHGDISLTVEALLRVATDVAVSWEGWARDVGERAGRWRAVCRAPRTAPNRPMHPTDVINLIGEVMPAESVVVADTGYMAAWAGVLHRVRRPGRQYFRAAGSLGWAIPGSIGVALGSAGRPVVCVTGDGGAGYNLMELETAVRLGVRVTILVLDNGTLAFEYHEQRYNWNNTVITEANDFGPVDYAGVARALGAVGLRAESIGELRRALETAAASSGPTLIHALVDRDAVAPVANYDRVISRDI